MEQKCERCGKLLWKQNSEGTYEVYGTIICGEKPQIECRACGLRQLLSPPLVNKGIVGWVFRNEHDPEKAEKIFPEKHIEEA